MSIYGRCPICADDIVDNSDLRILTGCRHTFHGVCLKRWIEIRPVCPSCRAPCKVADVQPINFRTLPQRSYLKIAFDRIRRIFQNLSEDDDKDQIELLEKMRHELSMKEREENAVLLRIKITKDALCADVDRLVREEQLHASVELEILEFREEIKAVHTESEDLKVQIEEAAKQHEHFTYRLERAHEAMMEAKFEEEQLIEQQTVLRRENERFSESHEEVTSFEVRNENDE